MVDGTALRARSALVGLLAASTLIVGCDDGSVGRDGPDGDDRILGHDPEPLEARHSAVLGLHGLSSTFEDRYDGTPLCTATIIGAHTVLTAAHCVVARDDEGTPLVDPDTGALVAVEPGALALDLGAATEYGSTLHPTVTIELRQIVMHDSYIGGPLNDLAILMTVPDALERTGADPIRPTAGMDEGDLDLEWGLELVGYGYHDIEPVEVGPNLPPNGIKMHTDQELGGYGCAPIYTCADDESLEPQLMWWPNDEVAGACYGDSGGPVLVFRDLEGNPVTEDDPDARAFVGGVISGGSSGCYGVGFGPRLDAHIGFLDRHLADLDGDGEVAFPDVLVMSAQFGGPGSADFNGNDLVDFADFIVLAAHFGS
ncbi:MAG: trypsin-like serine protease [Deltaproteobacteria bacterium]|nr:trypsin-like serine protease [Deltaproteobacteria bacterium]